MKENTLSGLSDVIQELGNQKRKEDKEFNDSLPEPDATYKTEDYEWGYFKVDGGVLKIQKYSNGYNRHMSTLISDVEIDAVNEAQAKDMSNPPR